MRIFFSSFTVLCFFFNEVKLWNQSFWFLRSDSNLILISRIDCYIYLPSAHQKAHGTFRAQVYREHSIGTRRATCVLNSPRGLTSVVMAAKNLIRPPNGTIVASRRRSMWCVCVCDWVIIKRTVFVLCTLVCAHSLCVSPDTKTLWTIALQWRTLLWPQT